MIIHLISGPRNISTALMYSFARRPDTIVVDEPFYGFYLRYTGADHPGKEEIMASMESDPEKIFQQIESCEQKKKVVFVKNMGHHLQGYDYSRIAVYQNIFLIRDPGQMLVSYAKVREQPSLEDIGLTFQAEIFEWLLERGKTPFVLDGNEVRRNPAGVLSLLCEKLNIPFSDKMLQWPAGPISEDGIWARYWYTNVHQSTSFLAPETPKAEVPAILRPVYEKALYYYDQLNKHSVKA
jgi:hypothetical protein